MDGDFLSAAWVTTVFGFEPEPIECTKLNREPSAPWRVVRYLSTALGGSNGEGLLHIPENPAAASLLEHNPLMLESFGHTALHQAQRAVEVETLTLDSVCDRHGIDYVDYIKIDVEGAELDILKAAPRTLDKCSAIKVEVSFLEQRIRQPLMHEVTAFMLGAGYFLAGIRDIHDWRRRPLPAHPYVAKAIVPYSRGVAAQCDLMFLKDFSAIRREDLMIRLIIVSAILGYFDYAVTIMRQMGQLEETLSVMLGTNVVAELGKVSRRIGRMVALDEIRSRLRSLLPLLRSAIHGIPINKEVQGDY